MSEESKTTKALKKLLKGDASPIKLSQVGLSSGSTLLNLACSGTTSEAFQTGGYYLFVGDSDSGKSFLNLTLLAEASINPKFKDYRLFYDPAESGALMDLNRFFGPGLADRLECPGGSPENSSETLEDFYYHLDDLKNRGDKFIYVLDSMDALDTDADAKKFQQNRPGKKGEAKDKPGSYGMAKAKGNSQGLRRIIPYLETSQSILIIICQARDSMSLFEEGTFAGGRALKFYANHQMWTSYGGQIKRTIKGRDRQLGIYAKIKVKKNRRTGQYHSVKVPIYHGYGIDDIGSCIDYLVEEGHWSGNKTKVEAPEFGHDGSVDKLIRHIEEADLEDKLRGIVGEVWGKIQEAMRPKRKVRYE